MAPDESMDEKEREIKEKAAECVRSLASRKRL